MSRHIKSPTRTISNRGPLPRFIGYFPCLKNTAPWIAFDSIASLKVALYLEWSQTVVSMAFENEKIVFNVDGKSHTVIPDYGVTLDTGEVLHVEAKAARTSNAKRQDELALKKRLFEKAGRGYEVIYRSDIESSGFIDTIGFLRRYALLSFSADKVERASAALSQDEPLTLAEYRGLAEAEKIPYSLLYYLLYHQRLPLKYVHFSHEELDLCRA